MKTGKFIHLGYYKDIRIGYGTIDYKNLKTVYLKFNSWILPKTEDDYDKIIFQTRKNIKDYIRSLNNEFFRKESIVDLDIRTKGVKLDKNSFMNLEITLYTRLQFDIKQSTVKCLIKNIFENVIDNNLTNKTLFNFSKRKESVKSPYL